MSEPISTASTHLYRDPEVFERERAKIFAKSWQFLGLEADMAHPGDYLAETVAGFPIMVLRNAQSEESGATALRLLNALSGVRQIAGQEVQSEVVDFSTPAEVADRVRGQRVAILYVSAGLEAQMGAVATALEGLDVLTVGPSGAYAEQGAVVGFDLDEGRPLMVINTGRARSQHVSFKAELLKMARIVGSSQVASRP